MTKKRVLFIALGAIALLLACVIGYAIGGAGKGQASAPTAKPLPTYTPYPTCQPAKAGEAQIVKETVIVEVTRIVAASAPAAAAPTAAAPGDDVSLEVTAVQDPAQPSFLYTAEAGKRLIAVELILANNGAKPLSCNAMYATLVDADGFTYQVDLGAYEGGQIDTVELAQGEKVRGWIAYQIPDNAKPTQVKYRSGVFGGVAATAVIK